ncbi:MAG TPA: serine/threonine-protein kinase [Kofleriaceae bacterium]|jgi:serine/threonine protein kinase
MDEQGDPRFLVGQVLGGRYWLQEHLGRGAMGDVFRARHAKVPRTFAVKVLHPELVADPKICARFEREAELAGRLHHRNVISVIDIGETARSRYLVMEFAEGVSLVDVIAGQALGTARVINLAKQICDGLQHAHENDLVHRDLKPENIIVERTGDDEVPRIVDFGLAILRDGATQDEEGRLTTRGIVLGTPHYLAPETALGGTIDHRIDLFALGIILYEMMTGVMPFDGDGVAVARANLHTQTPPMGVRVPGIDVDPLLEALVLKLLEKRPEDRPASAREVRNLLELIETDRKQAAFLLGVQRASTSTPTRALTDQPTNTNVATTTPAEAIDSTTIPSLGPVLAARDLHHESSNKHPFGDPRRTGDGVPLERISSVEKTSKTEAEWFEADGGQRISSERISKQTAPQRRASKRDERDVPTDQLSPRDPRTTAEMVAAASRRRRAVRLAGAAAMLFALVALIIVWRRDRRTADTADHNAPVAMRVVDEPAPAPAPAPAPPPVVETEEIVDNAADNAPVVAEAPTHARVTTKANRIQQVTAPAPAPITEASPPPAADVIEMYQRLGRRLKTIADRRDMAADDLWVRYRLVRIQDVYTSAAKRQNAVAILSGIQSELAKRFPE